MRRPETFFLGGNSSDKAYLNTDQAVVGGTQLDRRRVAMIANDPDFGRSAIYPGQSKRYNDRRVARCSADASVARQLSWPS